MKVRKQATKKAAATDAPITSAIAEVLEKMGEFDVFHYGAGFRAEEIFRHKLSSIDSKLAHVGRAVLDAEAVRLLYVARWILTQQDRPAPEYAENPTWTVETLGALLHRFGFERAARIAFSAFLAENSTRACLSVLWELDQLLARLERANGCALSVPDVPPWVRLY